MSSKKTSLILTLCLLAASSSIPSLAVENNELASTVLEPAKYVAGDKTKIEDLITSQLSNPLFSTGYGISIRKLSRVLGYTNHISLSTYIKKRKLNVVLV